MISGKPIKLATSSVVGKTSVQKWIEKNNDLVESQIYIFLLYLPTLTFLNYAHKTKTLLAQI